MARAMYLVGKTYLGAAEVSPRAQSIAYVCDACGSIWATIVIEGKGWSFEYNRCAAHPERTRQRTAGSLLRHPYPTADYLSPENEALALESLPYEALRREVLLPTNEEIFTKGSQT